MISTKTLVSHLDALLKPHLFRDYCPNGLQVEGKEQIKKLITGVTASQALIEQAIAENADAVLVHHGYFWKGESETITGMKRKRLKRLLAHDINLIAYHLPLDAHPTLGNNIQLAKQLGLQVEGGLEPDNPRSIGLVGKLLTPMTVAEFSKLLEDKLGNKPLSLAGGSSKIERIAWCTGAAEGFIDKAIALEVDAYLTGEVSEPTYHTVQEQGIHFFAAGHHATERYGVKALGEHLSQELGIEQVFIDIHNPI
ncbi:MAG: Nif3-like dinuclear metal center hexameric protein [Pseudomonadales bacterium]|nr:Nif3-like dinuclear metal center hexameric protein [Pseudomonadales bacterium]